MSTRPSGSSTQRVDVEDSEIQNLAEGEWRPSSYEWGRAFEAGLFGYRAAKFGKTVCRHGVSQWDNCANCVRVVLEFE